MADPVILPRVFDPVVRLVDSDHVEHPRPPLAHVFAGRVNPSPQLDRKQSPCGCQILTLPGRCALAIPCDEHVGKMTFEMRPKATE